MSCKDCVGVGLVDTMTVTSGVVWAGFEVVFGEMAGFLDIQRAIRATMAIMSIIQTAP